MLLTLNKIVDILALGLWLTSSIINLLVSSTYSLIYHFPYDVCGPQDESMLLRLIGICAQHNRFVHYKLWHKKEEHDKICMQGRSVWRLCNLAHDWNMCALVIPKDFIARANAHKVFIIVLHTMQMTQATSLLEAKPKIVFDINYDHLAPSMAIILSICALHLWRPMSNQKHKWQFKKDSSIESNQ